MRRDETENTMRLTEVSFGSRPIVHEERRSHQASGLSISRVARSAQRFLCRPRPCGAHPTLTLCPDHRSAACSGEMTTHLDWSAIGNISVGVPRDMSDMIFDTGGIEDALDVTTTVIRASRSQFGGVEES